MQNTPKTTILVLVVGLVAAVLLSMKMTRLRVDPYGIETKARSEMVYTPFFGMDKFWADVNWMKCLNQMGAVKVQLNEQMAAYFHKQFERITDLDPDFELIYKVGAPFIAYQMVDEAIGLMEKGKAYGMEDDWNRPYYQAHWTVQIKARRAQDEAEKKKHWQRAIDYLNEAIADGGQPWYVETMLLRLQAKKEGSAGDSFSELVAWHKYYMDRVQEYAKDFAVPDDPSAAPKGKGGKPAEADPAAMGMEDAGYDVLAGDENMQRLRDRILQRARSLILELLEAEATAEAKAKKEIQRKQAKVRAIYAEMEPTGRYCPESLVAYAPGELYDPVTGSPVTPYGVDLYDLEVNRRATPIRGKFNTFTGKPVAPDFDTLRALLEKEGKKLEFLANHTPEATAL